MPGPRLASECVTLKGVAVGDDSRSGAAVSVSVDGTRYWIPYSQVESISRDPRSANADTITITKWIADQKEIDYD